MPSLKGKNSVQNIRYNTNNNQNDSFVKNIPNRAASISFGEKRITQSDVDVAEREYNELKKLADKYDKEFKEFSWKYSWYDTHFGIQADEYRTLSTLKIEYSDKAWTAFDKLNKLKQLLKK